MPGWVEAFIVIAAVAIFLQMAILMAMFFQMKTAIEKFTKIAEDLQARVDPILTRTSRIAGRFRNPHRQHHGWMAPKSPASPADKPKKWTAFSPKPSSACAFR